MLNTSSRVQITVERYLSPFYYETIGFYTPEIKELIDTSETINPDKSFIYTTDTATCKNTQTNCKFLMDLKNKLFLENPPPINIGTHGIGSKILFDIILNKIM